MPQSRYVHVHLISDATGETLISVARAAGAQYPDARAIEHVEALVREPAQLERALDRVEDKPGIVLYTLVDERLARRTEERCREIGVPCASVLAPIMSVYDAYLQMPAQGRAGAQHTMDAGYFRRIDALNFVMAHDDGHLPSDLTQADVVLTGVSRTSKTPTAIYLANRGVKAANVPLVPGLALPPALAEAMERPRKERPLVVGLVATVDHILQIRRNRLDALGFEGAAEPNATPRVSPVASSAEWDEDGLDLDMLSDEADWDAPLGNAPLGNAPLAGVEAADPFPNTARDGVSLRLGAGRDPSDVQASQNQASRDQASHDQAPSARAPSDRPAAHPTLNAPDYVDRAAVSDEIAAARALCARHGWPTIDVTRRSIEETAAAVIALLQERRAG